MHHALRLPPHTVHHALRLQPHTMHRAPRAPCTSSPMHLGPRAPQAVDRLCSALRLPPGELQLPVTLVAATLHDAKLGAIGIALSDLRLSGLDGFGNISLFEVQPTDGTLLHHRVDLGARAALSLRAGLNLTLDGALHAFDIGVTLSNVSLRLATRSSIDASALGDLTLAGLLHRPACAAAPLLNLSLDASYTGLDVAPLGALQRQPVEQLRMRG